MRILINITPIPRTGQKKKYLYIHITPGVGKSWEAVIAKKDRIKNCTRDGAKENNNSKKIDANYCTLRKRELDFYCLGHQSSD